MRVRLNLVTAVVVILAALSQACVVDRTPVRDPLDQIWREWMLAGHYARWVDGNELQWSALGEDRIASSSIEAWSTKYSIEVKSRDEFLAGTWWIFGGLIGRSEVSGARLELFAKQNVRSHWPEYTARVGRDYSEDYFLVLRPTASGRGQIVKEWQFPPSSLALIVDPRVEEEFRRTLPEKTAHELIEQNKMHIVQGYLHFDPQTRIATVTITGLITPFEERVDLSREFDALKAN